MRKIWMIGTADSGVDAPYHDRSWEIWGVATRASYVTRADRWFECHRLDGEPERWAANWRAAMKRFSHDVELIMHYPEPDLGPKVVQYPYDRIVNRFGTYFMTSSFAWMMALAIDELRPLKGEPVEGEIGLSGVDMEYGTEYCVAPQMRVLTSDLRWIPAGDVEAGDHLIGFDETSTKQQTRRWRRARVESAGRLVRPCYRLFMADGTELVSSAEHRWLTWGAHEFKWRRTDKMATRFHRHSTKICKPLNVWDGILESRDAGYVAAGVDGEGHLCQGNSGYRCGDLRIGFSQRDNEMAEEFLAAAGRLGYEFSPTRAHDRDCVKYVLRGARNQIIEFLGKLRPPRLMAKFDASKLGAMRGLKNNPCAVERVEYIGEQEVVALKTSTGTFIAEGFASHNSQQRTGFRHFIDLAAFAGIPITRLANSGLAFEPVPYPMWQDDPLLNKLEKRNEDAKNKLKAYEKSLESTRTMIAQNRAIISELEQFDPLGRERIEQLEKETQSLLDTSSQISADIVHWTAVEEEQRWLRDYLSP